MTTLPTERSTYQWFFRYKLYHLPLWMVYHYLWWALGIGSAWEAAHSILFSVYSFKFIFYVIFQAIGVYFNLYFLIPRFLERGHYGEYVSLLVLTVVGTTACIVAGYYVGALWSERTFQELYQIAPDQYFHLFKNNALPSTIASMTLAMSIKLTKNWIQAQRKQQALEKRQQLLEKENLETELKFLRSQFNPHFLFNTINSIFVLIHKNPDMASESLAKFSDLLRYQLYECNEPQIPVERELAYVENFIKLEKLRQEPSLAISVHQYPPSSHHLTIAPFLLMPFVENAFKHVSQRLDQSNWITIELRFDRRALYLTVANSISVDPTFSDKVVNYRGLGLRNVQRRLDLMYPEQHDLSIHRDNSTFRVTLRVQLREAVPQLISSGS